MVGNLTDKPTVNVTSGGRKVARFTIAVDDGYRDAAGAWQTRPTVFQKIECWNDAEAAGEWTKGALVAVVGQLRATTYTHEGEQRRQQWFAADAAALVPRPRSAAGTSSPSAEEPPAEDDPFEAAK